MERVGKKGRGKRGQKGGKTGGPSLTGAASLVLRAKEVVEESAIRIGGQTAKTCIPYTNE